MCSEHDMLTGHGDRKPLLSKRFAYESPFVSSFKFQNDHVPAFASLGQREYPVTVVRSVTAFAVITV